MNRAKWNVVTVCLLFTLSGSIALGQNDLDESKCCCTTYETGQCLIRVRDKTDAELNRVYQTALKSTEKNSKDIANLRAAQRAWVHYRDATCKAEYGLWGGGSGGPNVFGTCIIRLTKVRTKEIKDAYLPVR